MVGQEAIKANRKVALQGMPVVPGVKRRSKPGRAHYVSSEDMPRVLSGLGIAIVSTSRGVMTGAQARKQSIGGELLALVW